MSNIKNFGIQGVNQDVQFGKGNGRLVFANGSFSLVVRPTGTELSRLQVAAPVNADDAVSFGTMNAAVDALSAKITQTSSAVDAELTEVKAALSTLVPSEIKSADGLTVLQVGPGFAHLGDATQTLTVDVSKAGEVALVANSTSSMNIRLAPQNGSVIIGDGSEDGIIQPEGGNSLTIAGGDGPTAGNVIIRAGHGETNGTVQIFDLAEPTESHQPGTKAYIDSAILNIESALSAVANTTSSVSSIASGLTNSVTTIQTAVANLQESAKNYTDTAIAAANLKAFSESVRASFGTVAESNGDHEVMVVPAGVLLRAKVMIVTPFTTGAQISIKTSDGTTLVNASSIDESQTGLYTMELLEDTVSTSVIASITSSGAVGSAKVVVEYIAA